MAFLIRAIAIVVFLGIWQTCSGRLVSSFFISSPVDVLRALWSGLADGSLPRNLWVTMLEAGSGFLAGSAAGGVVGVVLARTAMLDLILSPFIQAFYALPKVALAPLFIMWFGIGYEMRIIFVATIVFFLVFLNTYTGVRNVSQELLIVFRLMGARERNLLTMVVIPSALTWVFAGLRLSVPYALIGAIVGEMMASNHGLGFLLQSSASQFDTASVFATLTVVVVLAQLLNLLVRFAERVLMPWNAEPGQHDVSP